MLDKIIGIYQARLRQQVRSKSSAAKRLRPRHEASPLVLGGGAALIYSGTIVP